VSAEIDRIAPTLRPPGKPRGQQRWRSLLFLHWPVDFELLRELVPSSLELDLWEGTAYVGLVPFAMEGVRPSWASEHLAFEFLETNVRTYVHVNGKDPGVYFFSLDAASQIAVSVARMGWGLPYHYSEMQLTQHGSAWDYRVDRVWGDRPRLRVSYETGELLGPSTPGTLEHFLMERYFLHLERRGRVWSGRVHHAPYPVQRARVLEVHDELIAAAGLPQVEGPPALVHYAAGVDVDIFDLAPRAAATTSS
jgi:uncharacterized protein YqjF (DUF2071 family)